MPPSRQTLTRFAFGPFEVNTATCEVRKRGVRIKLSGQPYRILLALLQRPGELVSREELRQEIWPDTRYLDFEHGLHAGINRLRRALDDSSLEPKYVETVPTRGYRFICRVLDPAEVEELIIPASSAADAPPTKTGRFRSIAPWAGGIAAVALALAITWSIQSVSPRSAIWKLSRLTPPSEALYETPALSRDGKFVAYSSDANGESGQDLYVQRVGTGQSIRLTVDGLNNTAPDFSPDGSKLVFESGRGGGGIYEIPALGGPARLIVADGHAPRYSPDGTEVAYWRGAESVGISIPASGEVWIAPLNGRPPRRVAATLSTARHPIWSPDGKTLLVVGYRAAVALQGTSVDWWMVPADGGTAVKTGAYAVIMKAGLDNSDANVTPVPFAPRPGCWSPNGGKVTFSRRTGDSQNIWQLSISPVSGRVEGSVERLTTGSGSEVIPSCAAGSFVFANVEGRSNIWWFPLTSKDTAELKPVAPESADQRNPAFSRDGLFMTFLSTRSGPGNVVLRNLVTKTEQIVAPSPLVQGFPVVAGAGDRVAYSVYEHLDKRTAYVSAPGETPHKVCDGCMRVTDWSKGDQGLLVFAGNPYQVDHVDLASLTRTNLLKHPTYHLLYPRYSPDQKWISFTARTNSSLGRIYVAPLEGPHPIDSRRWIPVTDEEPDDYALWSTDGQILYFTSSRDGFTCLWAQPLEQISLRPKGNAFPVRHFHGAHRSDHKGFSVSSSRIAITLAKRTGSIWVMWGGTQGGSPVPQSPPWLATSQPR